MNISAETSKFSKLSYDEQKQCCLVVLEGARDSNRVIGDLYKLIYAGKPPSTTLLDIYVSALTVLSEKNEEQLKDAQLRLSQSRTFLEEALKKEEEEKLNEIKEAESSLIF